MIRLLFFTLSLCNFFPTIAQKTSDQTKEELFFTTSPFTFLSGNAAFNAVFFSVNAGLSIQNIPSNPFFISPQATPFYQAGAPASPFTGPITAPVFTPEAINAAYWFRKKYSPLLQSSCLIAGAESFFAYQCFNKGYLFYVKGDTKRSAAYCLRGIGLSINSFLLTSGGGNLSNSFVKDSIYLLSTTAVLYEVQDEFQQGFDLWKTNKPVACQHFIIGTLFSTAAFLPYALDYYRKQSTVY